MRCSMSPTIEFAPGRVEITCSCQDDLDSSLIWMLSVLAGWGDRPAGLGEWPGWGDLFATRWGDAWACWPQAEAAPPPPKF